MAIVLPDHPLAPVEHRIHFNTAVTESGTGQETRTSLSGNRPRQEIAYRYRLNDMESSFVSLLTDRDTLEEVTVPLFFEETKTPAVSSIASTLRGASISLEAYQYVESLLGRATEEWFINGRLVPFRLVGGRILPPVEVAPLPSGQVSMIPSVNISRRGDNRIEYFAINGSVATLRGLITGFDMLKGGTPPVMTDVYPTLTERPAVIRRFRKSFNQAPEILDFNEGGTFDVRSQLPNARVSRNLSYVIQTRDEWRYWKGFLNHIQGRLREFLLPTFTRDLEFLRFNQNRRDQLVVPYQFNPDATPDSSGFIDSVDSWNHGQYIRLQFSSGNDQIVQVSSIRSGPDMGEVTLVLNGSTTANETVAYISLVERTRLASDVITLRHYSSWAELAIATVSLVNQTVPISFRGGGYDSGYDGGYEI